MAFERRWQKQRWPPCKSYSSHDFSSPPYQSRFFFKDSGFPLTTFVASRKKGGTLRAQIEEQI